MAHVATGTEIEPRNPSPCGTWQIASTARLLPTNYSLSVPASRKGHRREWYNRGKGTAAAFLGGRYRRHRPHGHVVGLPGTAGSESAGDYAAGKATEGR